MKAIKTALWFTSLSMAVAALSYPQFFIYNPFLNGLSTMAALQTVTILGWVLTISAAPLALLPFFRRDERFYALALATAIVWPVSLIAVRVTTLIETGDPGFQYLQLYPIFILTDLVFPVVIYVILLTRAIQARTEERVRQALESQTLLRVPE